VEDLAMKNDMSWEGTDSSEKNKQQAASSHGNLIRLRNKAPSSIIHNPSSIPPGTIVGLRSKTPSPIPHSPSPLRSKIIAHCSLCIAHLQGKLARLRSKTPVPRSLFPVPNSQAKTLSPIPINSETIQTLLRRKDYLARKLVRLREGAVEEKAWISREVNALTGVLDFIWLILKTVQYEQLEKLRNLQAIEDGLLPSTRDCVKIRIPGALDSVRETLAAYKNWRQR
jgi:hypothetical protein